MTPVKFDRIHVAVDNSDHSNAAIQLGIELGKSTGASLIGSHVYAGKLHDVRFKQMEFTLPDEYKEETELEKQRRIHDALITRGLQLISGCYLDDMERMAQECELNFTRKIFDGRTFEPLVEDLNTEDYDLLILGALGQGATRDSQIGSVCERVLRRTHIDTLVVRDAENTTLRGEGPILVAMDGSEWSWGALQSGCALATSSGRSMHLVSVLVPEDDTRSLIKAHLEIAEEYVVAQGCAISVTLLETEQPAGTAIAQVAAELDAFAVAVGRHGLDSESDQDMMGSVSDHLIRQGSVNVLVTSRNWNPADEGDVSSGLAA